jgi:glyoxylase-like metal-dependent hydrolase (beta-lactamase superfamily II)
VWAEEPWGNPLRLYLDSLRRFEPIAPETLVLPSHGLPFRGLPARLRALVDHHDARLAECAAGLTEPRTAAALLPLLFRRELDTHQLAFAIGEALAHLHFLEADGRAARTVGDDGLIRFGKR